MAAERRREEVAMAIAPWHPVGMGSSPALRGMSDLQSEMNRLFDAFFRRPSWAGPRDWTPSVDVLETNEDLTFVVELPGVRQKDVSVSLTGDRLTVKGERLEPDRPAHNRLHSELDFGMFERTFQVPTAVEADKVTATYRDGLLEIRLPKAEAAKPREVKVEAS
jgi:HSP20 family protein